MQTIRLRSYYGTKRWHLTTDGESAMCGTKLDGRTETSTREAVAAGYSSLCSRCTAKADGTGGSVKLSVAAMKALHARAAEAGSLAWRAARPTPMAVIQPNDPVASLLGDDSAGGEVIDVVMDGVCGFAWVTVRPGTSRFARWLVKEGIGSPDSYRGGVSVREYGGDRYSQSYTRKMAAAEAYAAVLREAGIKAYADGRLD